jgi:glycosyltransferase involved in cell wall biosynthesis
MTGRLRDGVPVDVVVPTYRRPELLLRCLDAIAQQHRPPARVIVVVRAGDDASRRAALGSGLAPEMLHVVEVRVAGVVAAMAAGVATTTSPTIAFTDDDARPRPDWLRRIATHLEEPTVGGVGGRDVVPGQETPVTRSVGRFTRLGKAVGNHHLGIGAPRDVHVLKGVNMAFRAEALALPAPGLLRGDGAEVDFEYLTCAWARRQGWRLVYDPALLVDHEGAPREGADQRATPAAQAVFDAAYNSVLAATVFGDDKARRRIAYPFIVGTNDRPGLLRGLVALARGERVVLARLRPALTGRAAALRARRPLTAAAEQKIVTATALRERADA